MEAIDLMIGDWVCVTKNFTQKYHRIRALSNDEGAVLKGIYVNEYGVKTPSIFSPNDTEPIPLTPEILEKNGFTKSIPPPGIHARCYDLDNKEEKYHLTIANYNKYKRLLLNVDSEDSECFNIKCDYVHELQHALRLCRIKKEIVL